MSRWHQFFIALLVGLCSLFSWPQSVLADENFTIDLHAFYTVRTSGETLVEQQFTLKNNKPIVFAKEYSWEMNTDQIHQVRATEGNTELPITVEQGNRRTHITVHFPNELVGEGKTRTFTIAFTTPEAAIVAGHVLEVHIPRLTTTLVYQNYQVTLKTPQVFGQPTRVLPNRFQSSSENGFIVTTFSNTGNAALSAVFGQKQVFAYTLAYHLYNPTGTAGMMQIALPPDTDLQTVLYESLEPRPQRLERDADENWIASYELTTQKNLDVVLTGKAELHRDATPRTPRVPEAALTATQPFWETDNTQIQTIIRDANTPRALYDYVVSKLQYTAEPLVGAQKRLGAVAALANPEQSVCQEFTDLFVTLARAAGIPARRMVGFAYTNNAQARPVGFSGDILHTWPEYYDTEQQRFIPVDPTWEKTTGGVNYFDQFDLNHVVFAIQGHSSTTPFAAGMYKANTATQTKDVTVTFDAEFSLPPLAITTKLLPTPTFLPAWPLRQRYALEITNTTGAAFYRVPVKLLETTQKDITVSDTFLEVLLPFQTQTIFFTTPVQLQTSSPLRLTLAIGDLSSSYDISTTINWHSLTRFWPTLSVVGGVVVSTILTWRVLVSRRQRRGVVRR